MGRKKETDFTSDILKPELERRFPGCLILKQDPNMRMGIPDQLVLYKGRWAALETKRGLSESKTPRPLQEHYVTVMGEMSYAAFVYPENLEEVMDDLQSAFGAGG